jgi:hypothetical protein
MLYESEILVDLAYRVPGKSCRILLAPLMSIPICRCTGHACYVYTGFYQGASRQQRRQAERDFNTEQKRVYKANRLVGQILRQIFFPDCELYNQDQLKEMYGNRLFVTPYMDMCVARVSSQ